jgi:hypothetical protein
MKRTYKYQVKNKMSVSNDTYKKLTGSHRPLYMVSTLKKRYEPSCEAKMWSVVTSLGAKIILGTTLQDASKYLDDRQY